MKAFATVLVSCLLLFSCKKDSQLAEVNHPPVADAGRDTVIRLPDNIVYLNGSGSADPDNNIAGYQWRKVSGPACNLGYATTNKAKAAELEEGIYQFELTVTDARGLFSKDTVMVTVELTEITYSNLQWEVNTVSKMAFMQTPGLPPGHPVRMVMLYDQYPFWGGWFDIEKDGTLKETFYYTIVNNRVVAYIYYNDINDVDSLLYYIGNDIKVVFN